MWWDWTEITLLDSVLFSILTMLVLYLVGWGITRLICALSKRNDPLNSFDFFQKINFRIIFGISFVVLFITFFSLFNFPFLISVLLIIAIALIGFTFTRRNFRLKLPKKPCVKNYSGLIIVAIILVSAMFLLSLQIKGFYGSTNDDAAFHTLVTRIILDNPNVLITRSAQPYNNFSLIYPTGAHILCAYLVTLLNVPIQKIVLMMSAILPVLIALSFYSTIKCLFESKVLSILGLIIGAFFIIGLSWVPISWGGLPLLMSLYLSISSIGLIFVFLLKKKMNFFTALLLGLIFFIAIQTYPDTLLIVILWFLLVLSLKLLPKFKNIHAWKFTFSSFFNRTNLFVAIAFLVPILLSVPFLYFIYTHLFAGANFNSLNLVPSTPYAETVKTRISFNWLFDIPALSLFFSAYGKLLALTPVSLIVLVLLLIPRVSQRISSIFPSRDFARSLFSIYSLVVLIMSYLTLTIYLPINPLLYLLDSERVWQHLFIPAVILTATVLFFVIDFSYLALKRFCYSDKTSIAKLSKSKILACALLALLIFNVSLLSVPIVTDQQEQLNLIGAKFSLFQTLKQDDASLLKWITQNIPSNACILTSAGDSGQFVTAVTQRHTISQYSYRGNYSDLMTLLTSNSSDLRAVPLMIENNVSYVYIGSTATTYALDNPYYRHFNVTQFLSTSYFTLTKEIGDACLFQFNASAALTAYNSYGTTD